jgi:hypothetical protein
MTTITTTTQPIHYTVIGTLDSENVHIEDVTPVGNLTGVNANLTAVSGDSEAAYLAALTTADVAFDPLPDSGWLEINRVYDYNGTLVMVRQSHYRTTYAPAETPALFVVYREDAASVLDWIAGESVTVGMRRVYDSVTYECIQSHVTQSDWTPPAVPALWRVVADEPEEPEEPTVPAWAVGVAYKVGDVVTYNGISYSCRQAHTSQVGWEPDRVPALWLRL